jgi:hypothetical protein
MTKIINLLSMVKGFLLKNKYLKKVLSSEFKLDLDSFKNLSNTGYAHGYLRDEISKARRDMQIINIDHDASLRCITFTITNPTLISIIPSLFGLHYVLFNNPVFKSFGKQKVIIGLVKSDLKGDEWSEISFHPNILVDNKTTALQYVNKIIDKLTTLYEDHYLQEVVLVYKIKVWNVDKFANRSLKIDPRNVLSQTGLQSFVKKSTVNQKGFNENIKRFYATSAKDLVSSDKKIKSLFEMSKLVPQKKYIDFGTADIETVTVNGYQVPIAISCCYNNELSYFMVDPLVFQLSDEAREIAVKDMFRKFFYYTLADDVHKIFFHNLGSFDGRFILDYLLKTMPTLKTKTLMDHGKKFISISHNYTPKKQAIEKMMFLDSYRIFPVSKGYVN